MWKTSSLTAIEDSFFLPGIYVHSKVGVIFFFLEEKGTVYDVRITAHFPPNLTVFEGRTFYIINREGRWRRRPKCTSILENLTFNVTAFLNCFLFCFAQLISYCN